MDNLLLGGGRHATVDDDMLPFLSVWCWRLSSGGYVVRDASKGNERRVISLHRVIAGLVHGDPIEVDHISGDRLDNRRANLRLATRDQNNQNVPPRTGRGRTSQFRGVRRLPSGLWTATVSVNRKEHYLGSFETEIEAARVASAFRAEHMPFSLDARLLVAAAAAQ